jgi:hypothetical protein
LQSSCPEADKFREIAETSSAFVNSLVDAARENSSLVSDPMISDFVKYDLSPRSNAYGLIDEGTVSSNKYARNYKGYFKGPRTLTLPTGARTEG